MIRLVLRRLAMIPLSLLVITFCSFGLVSLMPGDPARLVAGDQATPSQVAHIRQQLGLDQPFLTRYFHYLRDVVHGNLGHSLFSGQSIDSLLGRYLPNSIELIVLSMLVAVVLGLALGLASAYRRDSPLDWTVRGFVSLTQAIPDFVLALVFLYFFFFLLKIAPSPIGRLDVTDTPPTTITHFPIVDSVLTGNWTDLKLLLWHSMLPALALGITLSAAFAKISRATLIPALNSHQVEFARACGLPERKVVRYAWLAARTPILTYGAILLSTLLGGVAIIETIFNWQGVGQWAVTSILQLDVPAIQGFVLVVGAATLLVYIVLDIVIALLDPRVSYRETR